MHLLIRYIVTDFVRWREVFEGHRSAQQEAGLELEHLWRNVDRPDEVILLFSVEDIQKAREFVYSTEIPQAKEGSEIIDEPDIFFLE
ncbi:MAG: hypothetical protein R3281_16200 [Balneolaceae bacterium]|nr:hypothetical protein [Balneolaceae bacterium]